jgi:hypothetical protein
MREVETPLTGKRTDWTTYINKHRLQVGCSVALIVLALLRAWFTRYDSSVDAMSYLDMARFIAEGHLYAAINGLWSPGYPAILSVFLLLFRPNAYWECPLAHFVNILIFVGALASFQLYWSEVRLWHEDYVGIHGTKIPEDAFWALGYAAFGISTLSVIAVALVEPDLLVAAFCCLAGWAALRLRRNRDITRALLLGLMLALGYYAKAPFFPMGFVFLLCACFEWPVSRRMALLGGIALAVFLLLCAPFVTALSLAKGRLTFGDSARLNHAFFIDGVRPFRHWQGGPPAAGTPVHPERKLSDFPQIYEFSAKDMGTYPAWFNATYWYEGITPHFHWRLQAKVFMANLAEEANIMQSGAGLVCAVIALALLAGYCRPWLNGLWQLWFVWVPGIAALTMYALIFVQPRYLGGWLVLLFAGVACACSLPTDGGTVKAVRCIGLAVLVTTGAALTLQASREAIGSDHAPGRSPLNADIAVWLLHNGLKQGDPVAVIGQGTFTYWAHLARLRVVAEIPNSVWAPEAHPALDFWESDQGKRAKSLKILEQVGVKAVIADPQDSQIPTPSTVPQPWQRIDGTNAYVYFFHR